MSKELKVNPKNPLEILRNDSDEEVTEADRAFQEDATGNNRRKRREVKFDTGDSSDDEDKPKKGQDEDEDDDMFGDDKEEEEEEQDQDGKQPAKRLDMRKFETEGEIDVYDLKEQEPDEEDEAVNIDYYNNPEEEHTGTRKKTEPKMEAFHLRDDLEEGDFDEEGNFIRHAEDDMAHQDAWLDGINAKSIKKAREAHESRQAYENEQEGYAPRADVLLSLVPLLQPAESPMEALQRLAPKKNARRRQHAKTATAEPSEDEVQRKKDVEAITGACEKLLDGGMANVYELSREELSRAYQRETGEAVPDLKRKRDSASSPPVEWEFKWDGTDEIHGPYPTSHMVEWDRAGYFDERARIRQVGESDFVPHSEVSFGRYLD